MLCLRKGTPFTQHTSIITPKTQNGAKEISPKSIAYENMNTLAELPMSVSYAVTDWYLSVSILIIPLLPLHEAHYWWTGLHVVL